MKVLSRIVIAIVALSIMIVACKPNATTETSTATTASTGGPNIVFINLDSLLENYDLYTESRKLLEDESRKAEQSIAVKLESFQKRSYDFQKRVYEVQQRAAELAPVQLKALEQKFAGEQQKLQKEEQDLVAKRDNAARGLEVKLIELQKNLKDKIDAHMVKIAAERNYDYVLIKGNGGGVLHGKKELDITNTTIVEMNKIYKDGGESPEKLVNEVAKDSTNQ